MESFLDEFCKGNLLIQTVKMKNFRNVKINKGCNYIALLVY